MRKAISGAFMEDMRRARYPRKVRELVDMEGRAVEMLLYSTHNINGLLQAPEYMRALYEVRHPPLPKDVIEREIAGRLDRQAVFKRDPAPLISFVQEQVTLERPIGGKAVLRLQLEHMLELAQLRNVSIQIMPTDLENHAGMSGDGQLHVLKFADGSGAGRATGAFHGRPVGGLRDLRILESRYGMIRAQALTPRRSLAFIEQMLGRL